MLRFVLRPAPPAPRPVPRRMHRPMPRRHPQPQPRRNIYDSFVELLLDFSAVALFVKFLLILALILSMGVCGPQNVTVGNTTLTETVTMVQTVTATPTNIFVGTSAHPAVISKASIDLEALSANLGVAPNNPNTQTSIVDEDDGSSPTTTRTRYYTYTHTYTVELNSAALETQSSTAIFRGEKQVFYYVAWKNYTSWLNGVTPNKSGVEATGTSTTTVVVSPVPTTTAETTEASISSSTEEEHTTITLTTTITPTRTSTISLSTNATTNVTFAAGSTSTTSISAAVSANGFNIFVASSSGDFESKAPYTPNATFSGGNATMSSKSTPAMTSSTGGQIEATVPVFQSFSLTFSNTTTTMVKPTTGDFTTIHTTSSITVIATRTAQELDSTTTSTSVDNGFGGTVQESDSMITSASVIDTFGAAAQNFSLTTCENSSTETSPTGSLSGFHNRYMAWKARRQVGAQVTATINGKVVTWNNNWDGEKAITSTSSSTVPAPGQAHYASHVQGKIKCSFLSTIT
jgi:hypothetical protein